VAGTSPGSKLSLAKALGVEIIDQATLQKMLSLILIPRQLIN
jgi:NAD-dependent DNA ligase